MKARQHTHTSQKWVRDTERRGNVLRANRGKQHCPRRLSVLPSAISACAIVIVALGGDIVGLLGPPLLALAACDRSRPVLVNLELSRDGPHEIHHVRVALPLRPFLRRVQGTYLPCGAPAPMRMLRHFLPFLCQKPGTFFPHKSHFAPILP